MHLVIRSSEEISLVCSVWAWVQRAPMKGASNRKKDVSLWKGVAMCTYQRPTLTAAGSFEMVTGLAVL
jgi:uncharacterized protein DUF5972